MEYFKDATGRLLQVKEGRVVDPLTFGPHDPDGFVEMKDFPLRMLYGPLWDGLAFNPQFRNIWTGDTFSSGHHARHGGGKKRENFSKGYPPQYAFCLEWVKQSDGTNVRCGQEFLTLSGGCAKHKNVLGRSQNIVFAKLKNDEVILWRDMMSPDELENIEQQRRQAEQPVSDKNQALLDKARNEGRPEYEVFEELKKQIAEQQAYSAKDRKQKAQAEAQQTKQGKKPRLSLKIDADDGETSAQRRNMSVKEKRRAKSDSFYDEKAASSGGKVWNGKLKQKNQGDEQLNTEPDEIDLPVHKTEGISSTRFHNPE
ncbi:hypothetical protein N0V90_009099 [Kalmusia sp. IMI 367209]|nr:hypothetical protein N0V90_009099 [Kalmusia sp. IMI 367209]